MNSSIQSTNHLRNVGIAAHIDAGKTTLTERLLYYSGAIHTCGDVHNGNTATDFSSLERDKGITISSAAAPCSWTQPGADGLTHLYPDQLHRFNIIDTPGHVDFTAEVERSLRVLDGLIAVFCGVGGVQPQSETVWRQANRYQVPRIAFINKMDRTGADFDRVTSELRDKLHANAWPVLLPLGSESELHGQLDVINEVSLLRGETPESRPIISTVPDALKDTVQKARQNLIEALASLDDQIAALWIEGSPVSAKDLASAIRRQTIAGTFIPVICGSAYRHVGVHSLMDAIIDYLPSPAETKQVITNNAPLAALAFKVVRHPQAGRLVYVRVYSGTIQKGLVMFNPRTGKTERCNRVLRVFADRRDELDAATEGDICALAGLREFTTGDTLCLPNHPVHLEPPQFPEPVISMAIEPASLSDQTRLTTALTRMSDEDPTFHVSTHAATGQCLISGMGELHLEVIQEKLLREHDVKTRTGEPQIACRETISATASSSYVLKKQNGGAGMYARVDLSVQPLERGSGLVIENATVGGSIPAVFMNAVYRGIKESAGNGPLSHSVVVDVKVLITDGDSHAKDSNEQAFRLAAGEAFRQALRQAEPVLLEPIMHVECTVPESHQGDILGDLNRRRARILGLDHQEHLSLVIADVPLAELFGYTNAIRGMSKGRASCVMTPSSYDEVPVSALPKLLKN